MRNLIDGVHVVFNRDIKIAFHSTSWGADISALSGNQYYHGWVHDDGETTDEEYFVNKGYKWVDRLEYLTVNAVNKELIYFPTDWEGDEPWEIDWEQDHASRQR